MDDNLDVTGLAIKAAARRVCRHAGRLVRDPQRQAVELAAAGGSQGDAFPHHAGVRLTSAAHLARLLREQA